MGQSGQVQEGASFVERIKSAAERIVNTQPQSVIGSPAPEPPVSTETAAEMAAGKVVPPVNADVALVRDQLEQVVTNFRQRIDAVEADVAAAKAQVAAHETTIEALVSALEAIK
jgi:hypothetical protein